MTRKRSISVRGARMHNLKAIDVDIPHREFVVVTGVSGSGKSSLAFDTIYAEGQRRYVESLSSYARQFLGRLEKPLMDSIEGLSPAIAIEQKVISTNPRSTVGTVTEVYDYLKLLFARAGRTYSPISGEEVRKDTVSNILDVLSEKDPKERLMVMAPPHGSALMSGKHLKDYAKSVGFERLHVDGHTLKAEELDDNATLSDPGTYLVIDRVVNSPDQENQDRLADSLELAFREGDGRCSVLLATSGEQLDFSKRFELDDMEFIEPTPHLFTFNNPLGACPKCEGFGHMLGIDPNKVIPDDSVSIYGGAIAPWNMDSHIHWFNTLIHAAERSGIPIHKPYRDLTPEQQELIWTGNEHFGGIHEFFRTIEKKLYKIKNRIFLSRYRGRTTCLACGGKRLRKEAGYVKIDGRSIMDLVDLPIERLTQEFKDIKLDDHQKKIAKRLVEEISGRLDYLCNVGLGYLTLNRKSATLSGGESQRIQLATQLGSSLVGATYILDEPSIGLHSRDTDRLIGVLQGLRDQGNTVIVVEHDEDIMKNSDYILDIGPFAGRHGGEVVFEGTHDKLTKSGSLTAEYLTGKKVIPVPEKRRKSRDHIKLVGARSNNIKGVDVTIPLHALTCITGVSGSGKSSLVKNCLVPAVRNQMQGKSLPGEVKSVEFGENLVERLEYVDQNPIGRSSRSNPVTYTKAFDEIRTLLARTRMAKVRGYQPGYFSFNVPGGRCEQCKGDGVIHVSMQFMADVELVCENCQGKRFKQDTLEVEYKGKNVAQILDMTIEEALEFFPTDGDRAEAKIHEKLLPLKTVGLEYLNLGQPSNTLSGGEAQRVKLATYLIKGNVKERTLFVFDEPTTGLHFHDVAKLLVAFDELIEHGHSVIVVEHHLDVIKCADHIVDMGPEGGDHGGEVVFEGTPEELVKKKGNYTAQALKEKL